NVQLYKNINITGTGTILQSSTDIENNRCTIFESNYTYTDTYNNDGGSAFDIENVAIETCTQSVLNIGAKSQIGFSGCNIRVQAYPDLPIDTVFFSQLGGNVGSHNCTLQVAPYYNVTLNKVFSIEKTAGVNATLQIINMLLIGRIGTLIYNEIEEAP